MKIKVSAPGKLMLFGEHAVVYGHPCIVTAVDKRLYLKAEIIEDIEDRIIAPQVKESRFVLESIACFKDRFNIKKNVKIKTNGDFSHRVGLGSSSAVTVATFKALSKLFKKDLSLREIFDLSYYVNIKIQGLGSGFDIAAATFGKTIYFEKAGKTIQPLNTKPFSLAVGYSKLKADTPFYVRKVAEAFKSRKKEMHNIFADITKIVNKARKSIEEANYNQLGELMNKNHALLQKLGVSIPRLDKMIEFSLKKGALGAKLSGAGGGDCMIALVSPNKRLDVENAIEKAGGEVIRVKNNTQGVRIESIEK